MPESNLETVKRVYAVTNENWAKGKAGERDWEANPIWDLFDPEIVIDENSLFPDADSYRGRKAIAQWWSAFFDVYDEVKMDPRELIPVGDRVLVLIHMVLHSRMGVELEQDLAHVWTLRDGKVVHVTGYTDLAEGFRDVGLAER